MKSTIIGLLAIVLFVPALVFQDKYFPTPIWDYVSSTEHISSVTKYDDGTWVQLKMNGHIVEYPIGNHDIVDYSRDNYRNFKVFISETADKPDINHLYRSVDNDGIGIYVTYPLKDVIIKEGNHEDVEWYTLKSPIENYPEAFIINYEQVYGSKKGNNQ